MHHSHDNTLGDALASAWDMLAHGARSAHSSSHIISIATVTETGLPNVRSVVLRGFDAHSRTLRFHTDARSNKSCEISGRPYVAVHLYDKNEKTQLRMLCRTTFHRGDAISSDAWRSLRTMSRRCYRQRQTPGAAVDSPAQVTFEPDVDPESGYENFATITAKIQTLERLYLSASGHRRAFFDWRNGTETSAWLAP